MIEKLFDLRRDYSTRQFNESVAKDSPFEQFKLWFDEVSTTKFLEPNAMVLSTASKDGKPSSRVLLLKQFDENGFVFFTNYESRKGKELEENPNANILFFWDILERQVRIEGAVIKITKEESEEYFRTRPYKSRLGAWASKQSTPLKTRFTLIREVAKIMARYPLDVPLPPYWGGYRLIPTQFEFWQGRPSRLHDRIQYSLEKNIWKKIRLYP
ncbi:MAG TPA: pyridoxamine 5'-phosphate oxidase [Candidatus Kapabacteria bacterium]|nr:pyridoxamine 5'-phosphate oxidase [Candidatus Kapabacteria bacterium]HPO62376.1 pyridoxamine 5'-phosphate oxidase [Candidatus Kapabacteria bacterium]